MLVPCLHNHLSNTHSPSGHWWVSWKSKNNREHLTLSRLLICWKLSPACWRPRVSWCCGSRAVSRRRILVRPILKLCTITLTRRTSLTLWYPRHQLQLRIGYFFGAASLAGAFSGLLAFAISFMSGTRGLLGWSWIFVSGSYHTILSQRLIHFIDHWRKCYCSCWITCFLQCVLHPSLSRWTLWWHSPSSLGGFPCNSQVPHARRTRVCRLEEE